MKYLVDDLGKYLCLAVLTYYTYRFYIRWEELHRLSIGHRIWGMVSFVSDIVLILVVTMSPHDSPYTSFFAGWALLMTGVWLQYNSNYAKRIKPAIDRFYDDPNRGPDTTDANRLERYLLGVDPAPAPIFNQHNKTWMGQAAFVLLMIIGFVWIVNVRADDDKKLVAAQKESAEQKAASDDSIKKAVAKEFGRVRDTLSTGQQVLLSEVKGNKKLVLGVAQEQKIVKAELRKRQSKPTRPQLLILNTTTRPVTTGPGPIMNREVKAIGPDPKPVKGSKKTAEADPPTSATIAIDSLPYWARYQPY